MAFTKRNYVSGETVITADNLNAIQDELIRVGGLLGKDIQSATINASGHLILTLTDGTTLDAGVAKGSDGVTPHIGDNGNWYLGDEDTGVAAKGAKGDTGAQGPKGDPGAKGDTGAQGPKGDDGAKGDTGAAGADGVTPHIGDNGNWYLGSTDTGKPSRGATGAQGPKGDTGDTGPQGPKGHTPVKGTDYWTAADKAEMVADVLAALPNGTEVSY